MTKGDEADPARSAVVKRRRRLELAVSLFLLGLLFGVILPQLIDYSQVWDTVTSLSASDLLVLLLLGFVRIGVTSMQHASVIVGLRVREAVRAYLAAGTLAEMAPPPADLAVRYGMYRSQGVEATTASTGIFLTGLFDWGAKLVLPVIALAVLVVSGVDDATTRQLFLIGFASVVGLALVVVFAVRSERFAVAFGRLIGRIISSLLVRFGRNPLEDLGEKSSNLREQVGETLRNRWLLATAATIGAHVMSYVILLTALRVVGVDSGTIDWVMLLVAYALVTLLTAIPLTPGGIGVAAVGYTWLLAPNDEPLANLIASASLLARVFTWLLPIVTGLIPLAAWRRARREHESDPPRASVS